MGYKQKGAPYEKDNMNMAVYRKDLGDGSAAKSNHTGIILQTGLSPEEEHAAIAHEKVHQYQQRKGDLDYDKENFYWKGKTYPRENLNEHNEKLPWEVEAYKESNKLLKGEQTNKQMADKFTLRNGSGNGASFKNLTSKGLMGASLDTNPIKISQIPLVDSKKAKKNLVDLDAKIPGSGKIAKTDLTPNDPGYEYRNDPDLQTINKFTKQYKAPTQELKDKGNKYWSSLSEEEKNEKRSKASTFTIEPIKFPGRKPELIPMDRSLPPLRVPTTTKTEKPKVELEPVYRSKKEIKQSITKQYPGEYRKRYGLGKNERGNSRKFSQGLTNVFGMKAMKDPKGKAAYDKQNEIRKAKKYANKSGVTYLDSSQSVADLRKQKRINKSNQSKKTTITKDIFVGNRIKKNKKA